MKKKKFPNHFLRIPLDNEDNTDWQLDWNVAFLEVMDTRTCTWKYIQSEMHRRMLFTDRNTQCSRITHTKLWRENTWIAIWLKTRRLFTLSHTGSDNSSLLIVFKWTFYELCLCIYYIMISTNQVAYFERNTVFLKMTTSFSLLSVA